MAGKFDNILIVSDLDGTFFGEDPKLLENNLSAVLDFQNRGGVFTIATGRDYRTLQTIFPGAKTYLSGPAILCNGVYLYDFRTSTVMEESQLQKDEFLSVLDKITKQFPHVGYRISAHDGYICPHVSPFMETQIGAYRNLIVREKLDFHLDTAWHKCVFVAQPDEIQAIWEFTKNIPMQYHTALPSFATLLEILPKSAGKGAKMERLKTFYPGRTAICVGDYTNDLDMLSVADIAACPENALEEIQAISKIHLCHHRDGCIADLIYKLDSSIKE